MRKILGLLALLCLTSPAAADGLLGTGFPITLGTTVISGSSATTIITGLSIAAGASNTLAALSFAGNGCTIGTDNLCVNGTTSVGNVNVTSSTIPANGLYLSAANTLEIATNSSPRIAISTTSFTANNASGFQMAMGATTCTGALAFIPNRSGSTNGYSGDGTKDCLVIGGADVFDVTANGDTTLGNVNVTDSTIPVNGMYLAAASQINWSTNSTARLIMTTGILEENSGQSWTMPVGNSAPTCTTIVSLVVNKNLANSGISGDGTKICFPISGVDSFDFAASGFFAKGTIPTVTGTGTPSITTGSTDTSGEVTGGVSATSIIITFAASKTNAPFCTVTSQTQLAAFTYTISTAAITITETATTGDKIDYYCMQH